MSTQNPTLITDKEWVPVLEDSNGLIQVLEGCVWIRSGTEPPDINSPPPAINGRTYWGHQYSQGNVDTFHDYGVSTAETVYALACTGTAVLVVTKY